MALFLGEHNMANILEEIEDAGRLTDTVVGHLTIGEIVIPINLVEIPEVKAALKEIFKAAGANLDEFTVGNKANKINPKTGYPEFGWFKSVNKAFNKVVDTVKKTTASTSRAVGNALTGGGSNKTQNKKTAPINTDGQKKLEDTYKANERAFEKTMAEFEQQDAERKKIEEKEARERSISAESSRISGIAAQNRADITKQLSGTLERPIQQNVTAMPVAYSPSGFSLGEPQKAVPGNAGGSALARTASEMPAALISQKINQDSGGTNQQQNRFSIPKTEGLVFGGT